MPQAIEWSLATPITRPRLPFITDSGSCGQTGSDFGLASLTHPSRLNTTDALVPPKPNEFDSTQPSLALSMRSRTIGMSAIAGSMFSMLALSQMKPFCIISIE